MYVRWLVLLLALLLALLLSIASVTRESAGWPRAVEAQIDWIGQNAWFPLQILLLWLVHARLLLRDYGAERLFWEERWYAQFFSLFGEALVVGAALMVWFLCDPPRRFFDITEDWFPGYSLFGLAQNRPTIDCGRFVLMGVMLGWVVLLVTKVAQVWMQPAGRRWRFVRSRKWFGPGLVGYLSALLFALLLHAVDYHEGFRSRAWWGFALATGAVAVGLLLLRRLYRPASLANAGILKPSAQRFWWSLGIFALVAAGGTILLWLAADGPATIGERLTPILTDLMSEASKPNVFRWKAPPHDIELRHLHAGAVYLSLVTVVLFALAVSATSALRGIELRWAFNPALLLCLAIVLSDLVLGFFVFNVRLQASFLLLLAAVFVVWNWGGVWWNRRYTFPNLDPFYAAPRPLVPGANADLVGDAAALNAHLARLGGKKLVVVATSGGGIRAAAWTAHLLETFDRELPGWSERVRLVTGASGGMVGAALWAGQRQRRWPAGFPSLAPPTVLPGRTPNFGPLADIAGTAALRPLVQTMLLRDLSVALLWPPSARDTDRGRELEAQWELAAAEYFTDPNNPFRRRFAATRVAESFGEHPSLVFSPTMVEDNRRCLISNLDLEAFASPVGFSRSAYELFKLFPEAANTFTLGTAARMNATFPIVGPLVPLPTEPPRRLMDAGLYDNYGIEFLSNWLLAHQTALTAGTCAGVVLIEIRAFPLAARGQGPHADDPDMRAGHPVTALGEAAAIVTGPLGALVRGRGNIMYHRNNAILADVAAALGGRFERVVCELDEDASLNWYLSEQERASIAGYDTAAMVAQLRAALA